MVKTPYLVAGAVTVAIVAALAYVALRPAPVAVAPKPLAPAATLAPAQPAAAPSAPVAALPPADCLLPGPPPVAPDGGAASAADMELAHDVIQSFVVHLEAYQACRESQVAKADNNVTEQQKQAWRDQGNSAIDEAQALAGAFAAQLKIYHKKHPEPLAQTPAK